MNCPECPSSLMQPEGKIAWCPACGWPILRLDAENRRLKQKLFDAEATVRDCIRRLKGLI